MTPSIAVFVLNLDRHTDRMARVAAELTQQGIHWTRFAAVDASACSDAELDGMVAPHGPIPRMPRGARACTASHFQIYRTFLASDAAHALVLEDDCELSPRLAADLPRIIAASPWGVTNMNRQNSRGPQKRLIVRKEAASEVGQYALHDLVGIHYGTAGYVIDRAAAALMLELYPLPDAPIDHLLFNPNISKLYGKTPIRQVFPALVRPREDIKSSIQHAPVDGSGRFFNRLKRAKAEVAILPRLLAGYLIGLYDVKTLEFRK